jgi:ribosomal protein S18 acetylase RimI-like enzyme
VRKFILTAMKFTVKHRMPSVSEYNELRALVEWPTFPAEIVKEALANSLFGVCVEGDDKVIGMGRVVGDKVVYFHLLDVIVHPQFQRKGIGKLLMTALMDRVEKRATRHTNIGLMASKGREEFYKPFGFIERPDAKFGAGMIKIKS